MYTQSENQYADCNGYAVEQTNQQQEQTNVSPIIAKAFGKNKVVDFRDNLSFAYANDYAMIHGCGGKNHAYNSTIECVICDFTKGKGDKSVNVSYGIPVHVIHKLYHASLKASFNELNGNDALMPAVNNVLMWLRSVYGNDLRQGQFNPDLLASEYSRILDSCLPIGQELSNAVSSLTQNGTFSYYFEKSNPYVQRADGYAPVSSISINYKPLMQDGSASKYPWNIRIENFLAPLKRQENGSSYHISKNAKDKSSATVMLSKDDFERCMFACESFIRNWEELYQPTIWDGLCRKAEARQQRNQNNNGNF